VPGRRLNTSWLLTSRRPRRSASRSRSRFYFAPTW
jgi:hypothetical protein